MQTLLLITQCAGIGLLFATMTLLFFRRIYLDSQTKQPIKFTLPLFGEISSQTPVLVLVFVGALMTVYPLSKMRPDMATVEGEVDTGGRGFSVIVVAVPDYSTSQNVSGKFSMKIPLLATDATYRIKYVVDNVIFDDRIAPIENGHIKLPLSQFRTQENHDSDLDYIPIKKEVNSDNLRRVPALR